MDSELAPHQGATPPQQPAGGQAPPPTDADNQYKAVQHKLRTVARSMDELTGRLATLRSRVRHNADRALALAGHIAHAELDPKFVEMTNHVSTALEGAAVATARLDESAQEVAADAGEAQRKHAQKYAALDDVRSGRRERTPKPGFFERH